MLNKLFARPLSLTIGGQPISFDTLAEFEFCLSGRTDVPARKVAALVGLSADELKHEAKNLKSIEKQFVDILQRSIESPGSIANNLRDIDPHVFSQDHNWRELILALNDKGPEYDELRRVALVKYMQYLASRQEVIKHTYAMKRQRTLERDSSGEGPPSDTFSAAPAPPSAPTASSRDTVIIRPVDAEPAGSRPDPGFRRLPKGEPVVLHLTLGQSLDLRISRYLFRLLAKDELYLVDDTGTSHRLQDGKNIIGRDTVCNVVVNPAYRDVSRLHLIVERIGSGKVRLTDLSSHGTLIPTSAVDVISSPF